MNARDRVMSAHLHDWDLSPREAIALQRELAPRLVTNGDLQERDVHLIAGGDVAFDRASGRGAGAVVVLAYPSLETVEEISVEAPVRFPYVPGLLSFRETPVLLSAFERLHAMPDLLLVDGHGYAHPRRFGFASHLGLWLGVPSIGVAKSILIGAHAGLATEAGARADLVDGSEVIGSLLRTRAGVRPIVVSIGSGLSLPAAERWVLRCIAGRRLPEPTRRADRLAAQAKRRMLAATLDVIIEQRAGERGRWEYAVADGTIVYLRDQNPMPEHYGCAAGIINTADAELLDVIVVDDRPRGRGERLPVRVIDMLERRDGDHKLLAVPVDVPPFASTTRQRLERARSAVVAWCTELQKPIIGWTGEDRAMAFIDACRGGLPDG